MLPDPADAVAYKRAGWWGETTVGDAVAGWAREHPDRDAIVADHGRVSWAGYDERADRLARVLVATGLRRGSRVAVLLPDGIAVHVAFVAAERAGLTVVGLGHRAGDDEIRHLTTLTRADALVTMAEHRGRPTTELYDALHAAGCPVQHHVVVDADGDAGDARPFDRAARAYGADDLFLVNSTSGTTGMPKCVMHTQNRWMYFHQLAAEAGDMTGDDVFLSAIPAPFGFGIWTAHVTPAVLGCPTVVHERFDADAVIRGDRTRARHRAGVREHPVPHDAEVGRDGDRRPLVAAVHVHRRRGRAVRARHPLRGRHRRARAAVLRIERDRCAEPHHHARRPRPPAADRGTDHPRHARAPARRRRRRHHDPDTPGHPVCRGPATCIGYLDDDRANDELFTADGWMRIGDLCTIDADGYLQVVGRTSDIVIRGGKNISAPAVEAAVAAHPAIAVAAAVAMPDEVFGERVCLYAELEPGAALSLDDVVGFLRDAGVSPEWFPERLVVLDALPRASGGKIAKGELRADIRRRLESDD